ncbi:MAG TPA: DUF748 domain-containing protein [Verrucomicrobiae bacterium]|nr:DUF748 domain-containing protein [Verrucomicrobiae bacterium]
MTTAGTEKLTEKIGSRRRRISLWLRWTILVLVVILVAGRLALPYFIKSYVNRRLGELPDYTGSVRTIDVHLWRGAYKILNIAIEKKSGDKPPVPFFSSPDIDLSLDWRELFHGAVVGQVIMTRPEVNFVGGGQAQLGTNQPWESTFESFYPVRINKFEIDDGTVRFRNFQKSLPVNVYLTNFTLVATNLSNARSRPGELPAGIKASGNTIGGGWVDVVIKANPLASTPTFELNAAVTNVDLTALNNFLESYGKFDVARGEFEMYTSFASAQGKYDGFVKVLFKDLDVFSWEKDHKKNILKLFWQAIVGLVSEGLKNQPHDQLAAQIPISGTYSGAHVGIIPAIGSLLKNAFIRALLPNIGQPVTLKQAAQQEPAAPTNPKPPP